MYCNSLKKKKKLNIVIQSFTFVNPTPLFKHLSNDKYFLRSSFSPCFIKSVI